MEALYRGSQLLAKCRALDLEVLAEEVYDRVRSETRDVMQTATRGAWLPVYIDVDLTAVIFDVMGEEGARRVCCRSIVESLNGPLLGPLAEGTMRLFGISPRHFFRMVPRGWRQVYRNAGRVECTEGEGNSLEMSYFELPESFFGRGYLEGIAGGLEGLLAFQKIPGKVQLTVRDEQRRSACMGVQWSRT